MKSKVNTIRMIGCLTAPLAAVMAATLATAPAVQATTYTSVSTGGNWQTNATWGTASTSYPGENEAGDTADISSGSPVTLSGTISNDLGDVNIAAGGTLELNNGASIPGQGTTSSTDAFNVGNSGSGTGTLDVASGSTSTVYNLNVGSGSQGGYVNQTGGTLTVANGAALRGNDGTYLITGGTLDLLGYYFGGTGTSTETFTLDVAGGTVDSPHYAYVSNGGGSGVITVNSGTFDNTAGFAAVNSSGNGTINLNGGTFETNQPINGTNSGKNGSSYINFNGGTLQATATISLLSNFTAANVQAGGAIINTNTFSDTISQALLHDATLGTTPDGGLTKAGAGTLTLSGTGNTYNGNTTVDNGTLQIDAGFLAATSTVSIASGALMNLDYAGTDTIASLILGGSSMGPGTYSHTNDPTYFGNYTGVLNVTGSNIPEPTTLALCGLGGVGLLLLRQRRRHA